VRLHNYTQPLRIGDFLSEEIEIGSNFTFEYESQDIPKWE
jgi:hypothetical protein